MSLPPIDSDYLQKTLASLLNIPSPTGYTQQAIQYTRQSLSAFPELELSLNRKGALIARWPGQQDNAPRALTAHVDTLGAMVKEVKSNGRLRLTPVGGYVWNTIEGEGCTVFTRNGETVRGSFLLTKASSHVWGKDVATLERNDENLELRLDARCESAEDVDALGIEVGDFVAFDPRLEINNGFVRSRHLDDKACVACLATAVKALHDVGLKPSQTTHLLISNFEEVGHGASTGIPAETTELVVLDMAAVGNGQASDEFHATICVKDSGGPYHHGLSLRLRQLADDLQIPYRVDIYPFYGSDGGAALRSGNDLAVALIGPGVDASHNYERTHMDALIATTQWTIAYLLS
jgi:putative aminopeptidase FrvX